jgi:hypothetical protein
MAEDKLQLLLKSHGPAVQGRFALTAAGVKAGLMVEPLFSSIGVAPGMAAAPTAPRWSLVAVDDASETTTAMRWCLGGKESLPAASSSSNLICCSNGRPKRLQPVTRRLPSGRVRHIGRRRRLSGCSRGQFLVPRCRAPAIPRARDELTQLTLRLNR